MLKMIVTDAVVSKGYENNPAIRFFDGERGLQIANFRIGKRIYDSKEEKNYRWINLTVKAFGELCERIKKMKLKEGSYINLIARYDEESWTDKGTGEKRTAPVLILDEIEYCVSSGNGQKGSQNGQNSTGTPGGGGTEYFRARRPILSASAPGRLSAVPAGTALFVSAPGTARNSPAVRPAHAR